ncbi:MAG: hypothetical protein FWD61_04370 [Phycisphaerales bacterium]|nr:hypothetical protein [Phycisphaerales bacterium]
MPEEPEEKDVHYYLKHPEEVDPEKMRRFLYRMLSLGQDDPDRSKQNYEDDSTYVGSMMKARRERQESAGGGGEQAK